MDHLIIAGICFGTLLIFILCVLCVKSRRSPHSCLRAKVSPTEAVEEMEGDKEHSIGTETERDWANNESGAGDFSGVVASCARGVVAAFVSSSEPVYHVGFRIFGPGDLIPQQTSILNLHVNLIPRMRPGCNLNTLHLDLDALARSVHPLWFYYTWSPHISLCTVSNRTSHACWKSLINFYTDWHHGMTHLRPNYFINFSGCDPYLLARLPFFKTKSGEVEFKVRSVVLYRDGVRYTEIPILPQDTPINTHARETIPDIDYSNQPIKHTLSRRPQLRLSNRMDDWS